MIALRFYASDIFREIVADIKHISRQIVENALNDVTNCVVGISKHHIIMPVDVIELNNILKNPFYEIAHFPNTGGAIDCTSIRLKSPSTN